MNRDISHANRIMARGDFSPEKRRLSVIWAAKHNHCEKCGALEFNPCINLTRRKQGFEGVEVKWPHENRIDYQLLISTLHQRGYY